MRCWTYVAYMHVLSLQPAVHSFMMQRAGGATAPSFLRTQQAHVLACKACMNLRPLRLKLRYI